MTHLPMNRELRLLGAAAFVLTLGACGHDFEPPDQAARVARAEALYSAELFDTLTWESADQRAQDGNGVYAARCNRCHGTLGSGETDYAASRGLNVPSLVGSQWAFRDDLDAVRRYIFAGHENGMPSWGLSGLSLREVDGVAYYVLDQLRSDALQP